MKIDRKEKKDNLPLQNSRRNRIGIGGGVARKNIYRYDDIGHYTEEGV